MEAQREYNLSNDHYLIVLDGGTKDVFEELSSHLIHPKISCECIFFAEPDLNNERTGFTFIYPCTPKKIKSLPLLFAGKEVI